MGSTGSSDIKIRDARPRATKYTVIPAIGGIVIVLYVALIVVSYMQYHSHLACKPSVHGIAMDELVSERACATSSLQVQKKTSQAVRPPRPR